MRNLKKIIIGIGVLLFATGLFAQDWYVCVGSYSSNDNANELVYMLQKKEINSFIFAYTKENGTKLFRVLIDEPFSTRDEARFFRDKMEDNAEVNALGISGLWICQAEKTEVVETIKVVKPVSNEVKIVLTWNNKDLDLDSTVLTSNCQIDFENPEKDGIKLEFDEDADYAPETIIISNLKKDELYQYFVEDYDNYYENHSTAMADSSAMVQVYINGECKETYKILPALEGTTWHVFDIQDGEINVINIVNNDDVGE